MALGVDVTVLDAATFVLRSADDPVSMVTFLANAHVQEGQVIVHTLGVKMAHVDLVARYIYSVITIVPISFEPDIALARVGVGISVIHTLGIWMAVVDLVARYPMRSAASLDAVIISSGVLDLTVVMVEVILVSLRAPTLPRRETFRLRASFHSIGRCFAGFVDGVVIVTVWTRALSSATVRFWQSTVGR